MDDIANLLQAAHEASGQRDWLRARDAFVGARERGPLTADGVYDLGDSVWWVGPIREAEDCNEEAHRLYLLEGRPQPCDFVRLRT